MSNTSKFQRLNSKKNLSFFFLPLKHLIYESLFVLLAIVTFLIEWKSEILDFMYFSWLINAMILSKELINLMFKFYKIIKMTKVVIKKKNKERKINRKKKKENGMKIA